MLSIKIRSSWGDTRTHLLRWTGASWWYKTNTSSEHCRPSDVSARLPPMNSGFQRGTSVHWRDISWKKMSCRLIVSLATYIFKLFTIFFIVLIILWHQSPPLEKLAENAWYLPIFNEFDHNGMHFVVCVVCYRNWFSECIVVSTLFTAFTNIYFKELDGFPKLIILEVYNYSPRYILYYTF